ncbi:hypothetical protein [Burkholderia cenocepacia]|uniref:hypothetical protein n=1 Tax=Burkholderia cenocepacia TaxID=95486 RepID=UPI00383CE116
MSRALPVLGDVITFAHDKESLSRRLHANQVDPDFDRSSAFEHLGEHGVGLGKQVVDLEVTVPPREARPGVARMLHGLDHIA